MVDWRLFYREHETYTLVGKLAPGLYYDANGEPTEELLWVEDQASKARGQNDLADAVRSLVNMLGY